jgi:hypothetical protein
VRHEPRRQSPFATDLFFLFRSTGSKQTLNGLFYIRTEIFMISKDYYEINPATQSCFISFQKLADEKLFYLKRAFYFPHNP